MMKEGDSRSVERAFTNDEILIFGRVTGDQGIQHIQPNPEGHLMVHGLLLASLPTQIGGEMSFLARDIAFEFLRPVYAGDPIRCTVTLTKVDGTEHGTRLSASFECIDLKGVVVMRGTVHGLVRQETPPR